MNATYTYAEKADRLNTAVAFAMFFMGIAYGCLAIRLLTSEEMANYLSLISKGTMMVAVAIILWTFTPFIVQKVKAKKSIVSSRGCSEPEGFITQSFHRACLISWMTVFVSLSLIGGLDEKMKGLDLPAEFYISTVLCMMLIVTSLTFFYLTRSDDVEEA